ncbi:MAG: hypothetical protein IK080_10820 [Clostridia bacterium]|nr:hypothetical protein [Clostridia bacterium]
MKRVFAALAALMLSLQLAVTAFADAVGPMSPGQLLNDPAATFVICAVVAVILAVAVILLIRHSRKKKARNLQAVGTENETNTNANTNTRGDTK